MKCDSSRTYSLSLVADFFVVCVGFAEMTPGKVIFEAFPVVILRLLRLLRVFRLAKALPRLRSIVEALISGFSAVGWIIVLITVFNYIMVCLRFYAFLSPPPCKALFVERLLQRRA